MKQDTVYKRATNEVLDHVGELSGGTHLPPESHLAAQFGVSRTTIRKVVARLRANGILQYEGHGLIIARPPRRDEFFAKAETMRQSDQIEKQFMEWMLQGNRRPGDTVNGLELARQFNASPGAIRDYLNRFGHLGLIEKRPNYGWIFRGFTTDFALELFAVRELFEVSSARVFARQPAEAPAWKTLMSIDREHDALLEDIDLRYQEFSELDERFHRLINDASSNRFFESFYDVISLIFHYHYQWNKADERERNKTAIAEHKKYIAALVSRDQHRIEKYCQAHLASARKTLLASIA